jgi:hypothetical protein
MSVTDYKTDREIQQLGMEILYKGLSVSDFIRFMQQFNKGYGNYVEDRQIWQKHYSVNQLIDEIRESGDTQ